MWLQWGGEAAAGGEPTVIGAGTAGLRGWGRRSPRGASGRIGREWGIN
jgi:hypothetical protein